MAMTAQGMVDKIVAARSAIDWQQTDDPAVARGYAERHLLALCQGIIAEIVTNLELIPVLKAITPPAADDKAQVYAVGAGADGVYLVTTPPREDDERAIDFKHR